MTALLRTVRRQQGLTLERLAEQTGLTKSYLSKVEREQATPSIAVAVKVARALGVDVAQLFSERSDAEKIVLDRAGDRDTDRPRYRALAAGLLGKSMSPFMVRPATGATAGGHPQPTLQGGHPEPAPPGGHPQPTLHDGQEFVFVHAGTVELDYGDQTLTLTVGDSAYFDASISHRIRSIGAEPAEVLVVAADEPGSPR